jgi:hypothetical protein
MTPCGSSNNHRGYGRIYRLNLQCNKARCLSNSQRGYALRRPAKGASCSEAYTLCNVGGTLKMGQYVPTKHRFFYLKPHEILSQMTTSFIVTAVKNLPRDRDLPANMFRQSCEQRPRIHTIFLCRNFLCLKFHETLYQRFGSRVN